MIVMGINSVSGLRINEIMFNPEGNENYNEWIEIYNDENEEIDLSYVTLCGVILLEGYVNRNGELNLEEGLILEAGEYAVITDGGSNGTEVYENYDVEEDSLAVHVDAGSLCKGGLTNSGKKIVLEKENEIIDEVNYTYYVEDVEEDYTLEYVNSNFVQSRDKGGTPGSENSEGFTNNDSNSDDLNSDRDSDSDSEDEEENLEDDDDELKEKDSNNTRKTSKKNIEFESLGYNDKIVLESKEKQKEFVSKQEKIRMGVLLGFMFLLVVIAVLLALRKL